MENKIVMPLKKETKSKSNGINKRQRGKELK